MVTKSNIFLDPNKFLDKFAIKLVLSLNSKLRKEIIFSYIINLILITTTDMSFKSIELSIKLYNAFKLALFLKNNLIIILKNTWKEEIDIDNIGEVLYYRKWRFTIKEKNY